MTARQAWRQMLAVDQRLFNACREHGRSSREACDLQADSDEAHVAFSDELKVYDV